MRYTLILILFPLLSYAKDGQKYFEQRKGYFQRHLQFYGLGVIKKISGESFKAPDWGLGLSYRVAGWKQRADISLRVEGESSQEDERRMTLLSSITFPDVESRFPLYFGTGLGLGRDLSSQKNFTETRIFVGGRISHLLKGTTGFFLELGGRWNYVFGRSSEEKEENPGEMKYFVALGTHFIF